MFAAMILNDLVVILVSKTLYIVKLISVWQCCCIASYQKYLKVVNNISVVAPTLILVHWCCKSVREEDWQYTWKYSHPASVTYLRAQRVRVTCHGGWQGGGRGQQGDRKDGGEMWE